MESQKVRKYLPDFLKKLVEDLSNGLRETREQTPATPASGQPGARVPVGATDVILPLNQELVADFFSILLGQEASASGLASSKTRRGLVNPGLAVVVFALVRD